MDKQNSRTERNQNKKKFCTKTRKQSQSEESSEDESPTFRDQYYKYINSTDETNKTNGRVDSDSHSDPDEPKQNNGLKKRKIKDGKKRSSNGQCTRSRSLRRSQSRSSKKGTQRSSSRKTANSQNGRESSARKSGSQNRKPERTSSRKRVKSPGHSRFRSVRKTRIWIPRKSDEGSISNSITNSETFTSDSDSEACRSQNDSDCEENNCEREEDEQKGEGKVQKENQMLDQMENNKEINDVSGKEDKKVNIKKSNPKSINKLEDVLLIKEERLSNGKEDDRESTNSLLSSQTYTLGDDEKRFQQTSTINHEEEQTKSSKRDRKARKRHRRKKTEDKARFTGDRLCSDTSNGTATEHHDNDINSLDNDLDPSQGQNIKDEESVCSGYSSKLARLCDKYGVHSDTTSSDEDTNVESADTLNNRISANEKEVSDKPNQNLHVNGTSSITDEKDEGDSQPHRKRSVTFSDEVTDVRSPNGNDKDDTNKGAEQQVNGDNIQMERDGFRTEMHRLHSELVEFKIQCREEADEYRVKLEKKRSKLKKEDKERTVEDALEDLVEEGGILKRNQKLLDIDNTLVEKEEELSQRNQELQSYEQEIEEIEGYLNRRHHMTKRKEAEILELDEELSRLKESLRIKKANVESELGVDPEIEESKNKTRENWELIKDSIDTKAHTMQSTVKKYKADLATAENTMTDLHNQVGSLEEQLSKRERKIKELESQLSLTLSQVMSTNSSDNQYINGDTNSDSDPLANTIDTISADIPGSATDGIRRHSMSSVLFAPGLSEVPRGSRASLTPRGLIDPSGKNPLKPRWASYREPKGPERPNTGSRSEKNGWRPVSRTFSDPAVPATPRTPNQQIRKDRSGRGHRSGQNGNTKSNACVIA